ncbi:hypothetical protein BT69DRAFT_1344702 [Atractiella rhizophila]|nr:hypothetical protein BT69DRAFT_1344702 [Atractiella rhizophila]
MLRPSPVDQFSTICAPPCPPPLRHTDVSFMVRKQGPENTALNGRMSVLEGDVLLKVDNKSLRVEVICLSGRMENQQLQLVLQRAMVDSGVDQDGVEQTESGTGSTNSNFSKLDLDQSW